MPVVSNPTYVLPPGLDPAATGYTLRYAGLAGALPSGAAQQSPRANAIAAMADIEANRAAVRAAHGPAAMTIEPYIATPTPGTNVIKIPAQYVSVDGRLIFLFSPSPTTSQALDTTELTLTAPAAGLYMVLLETWDAPVLASTSAGVPTAFSGVTSSTNKPNSQELFPHGGVAFTLDPSSPVIDSNLRSGTSIQTQEFVQTQYVLSVVAAAPLDGRAPSNTPSGTPVYYTRKSGTYANYGYGRFLPEHIGISVNTNPADNKLHAFDGVQAAVPLFLIESDGTNLKLWTGSNYSQYTGTLPIRPMNVQPLNVGALLGTLSRSITTLQKQIDVLTGPSLGLRYHPLSPLSWSRNALLYSATVSAAPFSALWRKRLADGTISTLLTSTSLGGVLGRRLQFAPGSSDAVVWSGVGSTPVNVTWSELSLLPISTKMLRVRMTLNSTDYSTSLGVAVFPGFSDPPNASTSYDAAAFEGTTFSVTSEFDVEVDTARQFTLALAVPLTGTPSGTAKVGFIFSILGYWT